MDEIVSEKFVSIIMPAYNAEKYIEESIKSVLAQTFSNWELIIIDDGSTDLTSTIVKKYVVKDSRIVYFFQSNKKQAAARNVGLKIAKGEWIAFIDADDLWVPNKLALQLELEFDADVIFTGGIIYNEADEIVESYPTIFGFFESQEMYVKLYSSNPIPNLSVLFKSEWIKKSVFQCEKLEVWGCEDWDYWLKLAKNGATFFGINEMSFIYRVHPQGTSSNRIRMLIAQFNALYYNIDYRLLSKKKIYEKLSELMEENIISLLLNNGREHALDEIKKVLNLKFKINYFLVYLVVFFNLRPAYKYLPITFTLKNPYLKK